MRRTQAQTRRWFCEKHPRCPSRRPQEAHPAECGGLGTFSSCFDPPKKIWLRSLRGYNVIGGPEWLPTLVLQGHVFVSVYGMSSARSTLLIASRPIPILRFPDSPAFLNAAPHARISLK